MKKIVNRSVTLFLSIIMIVSTLTLGAFAASVGGSFTDVEPDRAYAEAVEALATAGIMMGVGDSKFAPDQAASRAMAITVLGRMAGVEQKDTDKFSDVVNSSWYSGYVGWAEENGIVLGDGAGHYVPNQAVTGEEMELILTRYANVVGIAYTASNTSKAALTRGELAQMVYSVYLLGQNTVKGTQTVVIEGFDWGPAVTKTIITLDTPVAASSVNAASFAVTETKESFNWGALLGFDPGANPMVHITATAPLAVLNAYACDAKGNQVSTDSNYIALEIKRAPDTASPYCYDVFTWHNTICNPYELAISLTADSTLAAKDGASIDALAVTAAIDLSTAIMPQLKDVDLSGTFTGKDGKTLLYGSFTPANADNGEKHPLVIWLHGAGEGGMDASIPILGNKVTALYEEEFQTVMGGAYVLTPQAPDFWMRYDERSSWEDNPGTPSIYTETLMELIETYVAANPTIDTNRIYIGGCSNGGYMTLNMVLQYPDYFAAAYPICEAYLDEGITDEQLAVIKNLPIWFVYAENDDTVKPENCEIPTISRLKDIGADVHTSIFPNVVDTSGLYTNEDGTPHAYQGHWSWLYFFNNKCEENSVRLWNWLAAQSK